MESIARRVTVRGRVTGIGFRYSAMAEAQRHRDLAGTVRNVDRSTVECVLQGPRPAVEALVEWLRQGPPGALVLEHSVVDLPVDPSLRDFRITR